MPPHPAGLPEKSARERSSSRGRGCWGREVCSGAISLHAAQRGRGAAWQSSGRSPPGKRSTRAETSILELALQWRLQLAARGWRHKSSSRIMSIKVPEYRWTRLDIASSRPCPWKSNCAGREAATGTSISLVPAATEMAGGHFFARAWPASRAPRPRVLIQLSLFPLILF